jgi:protease-4
MRTAFAFLTVLLVSCVVATSSRATTESSIPSYYSQLRFNLTSPGAFSTAAGGFANPAVYGMLPGGEAQFSWSDKHNSFGSMGGWGLFLAAPSVGFGVVRSEIPLAGGGTAEVNDMRLALAGGNKNATFGIGYGWSTGDNESVGRSKIVQLGLIQRIGRYFSLGASGNFAMQNGNQSGLFEAAARPLGTQMLTAFADLELPKNVALSDAPWSVGGRIEPLPGVALIGRYFEDKSFALSVGLSYAFGTRVTGTPQFDKNGDVANTLYSVRAGFPEWSVFDNVVGRDHAYLELDLKGAVKYRGFRYFDEESHPLAELLSDLDKAKDDDGISGVAINLSGAEINRGMAWEIRQKLQEVQAAGKHVVIFADDLGMTEFYLASVADRFIIDPEGTILIPGYVMGRTFIRDLLEKIGLGFDEWRFFKYKSAAEAFSRDSMSEADREQRYALIEDLYAMVRQDVATSRHVDPATFDEWVNKDVLISGEDAVKLGLADGTGRWEDVKDTIKKLEGSNKEYVSRGFLAGNRNHDDRWGENPKIAIVYALGECAMDTGIHARQLEKIFHDIRDDRSIKGVVFRVDSPGGSGLASDVVAIALKKCAEKKPVIVSQGNVAASGGYWISMYGTQIYALPSTITGSIGVIGGWVWDNGIGEKIGHTSDHVQIGDHADLGAGIQLLLVGPTIPKRNLTADERDQLKDEFMKFYNTFVGKVADGRHMSVDAVGKIAQGHVFSGVDGLANGLVDKIGGLDASIHAARTAAGLDDNAVVDVVEYPQLPPFDLGALKPFSPIGAWFGRHAASEEPEEATPHTAEWTYLRSIINQPGRPLYMIPPELLIEESRFGQ